MKSRWRDKTATQFQGPTLTLCSRFAPEGRQRERCHSSYATQQNRGEKKLTVSSISEPFKLKHISSENKYKMVSQYGQYRMVYK